MEKLLEKMVKEIFDFHTRGLTFKSGKAAWRTDNSGHVAEAKSLGLTCGVEKVVSTPKNTCFENVKLCKKSVLCSRATRLQKGRLDWFVENKIIKYVLEAKRRGLSCGVNDINLIEDSFKNQSFLKRKQTQYALEKLDYYSSSIDALYGPRTETALINFANAKGLNINNPDKVFKTALSLISVPNSFPRSVIVQRSIPWSGKCADSVKACKRNVLCARATSVSKYNGDIEWGIEDRKIKYVKEAKRRRLSCGVK
jgi:hypothetical protein